MDENKTIAPKLAEALKSVWESLTDEQKEKAKQCKTMEELTLFAGKEGVELPDELLDAVAGGYITKVDTKYDGSWWEVLDDKTLEPIYKAEWHMQAHEWAEQHGQSTAILSGWALEQERKKRKRGCS